MRSRPGLSGLRVYMMAFRAKIVPILMTVLSTILGFIPFLIGSAKEGFWFPLAAGTIGGLLFSLLAVSVYLPLFLLKRPRALEMMKQLPVDMKRPRSGWDAAVAMVGIVSGIRGS